MSGVSSIVHNSESVTFFFIVLQPPAGGLPLAAETA